MWAAFSTVILPSLLACFTYLAVQCTCSVITGYNLEKEVMELREGMEVEEDCLYSPTPPLPSLPLPPPVPVLVADPDPGLDPDPEPPSPLSNSRCCGETAPNKSKGTIGGLCPCPCPPPFVLLITLASSSETAWNNPDSCNAGTEAVGVKAC